MCTCVHPNYYLLCRRKKKEKTILDSHINSHLTIAQKKSWSLIKINNLFNSSRQVVGFVANKILTYKFTQGFFMLIFIGSLFWWVDKVTKISTEYLFNMPHSYIHLINGWKNLTPSLVIHYFLSLLCYRSLDTWILYEKNWHVFLK